MNARACRRIFRPAVTIGAWFAAVALFTACGENGNAPGDVIVQRVMVAVELSDSSMIINQRTATILSGDSIVVRARLLIDGVPTSNMQPIWRSTDGAVAKTTNLPSSAGGDWARISVRGSAVGQTQLIAGYKGIADTITVYVVPRR